jgi:hypothetical protein
MTRPPDRSTPVVSDHYISRPSRRSPGCEFVEVFLNGVRLPNCIEARRGAGGWAVSYVVDDAGRVQRDGFDRPKETERQRGRVEFRRCDAGPFTSARTTERSNCNMDRSSARDAERR